VIANEWVVWLILILPLAAFVLVGLIGRRLPEGGGHVVVGAMAGSFVLSLYVFVQVLLQGGLGGNFSQTVDGYIWLPSLAGNEIRISILIDNLSALMLVLVSFLCLLIFIYSLGYMHDEEGKPRYYAEVSLFATGMLGTVSADNFLQLLIFWEIMGLCSYLLIGFWYTKPEAAAAAKKAFLVTRVGDVLFLVGVLVIWNVFGTLSFEGIRTRMASLYPDPLTPQLLTLIPLLLFGGAVGKSAQFPLHAWLPDAMEGPTTVSALIHAATMVKAGVYITARTLPILALFPEALATIAVIGAITALMAATMALVVFDIKRVLAYSTISQLAYMFVSLGTLGLAPALFHLMDHAFFKALLFLGSGSVIHGTHTQDMRQMGGLKDKMPWTYRAMLAGSMSLAGIPGISGWWSKDEILTSAARYQPNMVMTGPLGYFSFSYTTLGWSVFALGLITAGLTAFYTFRMVYLTFYGKPRYDEELVHPHESPAPMVNVLKVLSAFALLSGAVTALGFMGAFDHMIVPDSLEHKVTEVPAASDIAAYIANPVLYASTLIALLGVYVAYFVYKLGRVDTERLLLPGAGNPVLRAIHYAFSHKWGMDWLFLKIAAAGDRGLGFFADFVDRRVIDGVTFAFGRGAFGGSDVLRRAADGVVRNYTAWIIGGIALLLIVGKFVLPSVSGGGLP